MKANPKPWHFAMRIGIAKWSGSDISFKIEYGPFKFWRKRCVRAKVAAKPKYRRPIKRKVRTCSMTVDGFDRALVEKFLGVKERE